MNEEMIDFGPLVAPPPGMKPCSPELRGRLLDEFDDYYASSRQIGKIVRVAIYVIFTLIATAFTYVCSYRLSNAADPLHVVRDTEKIPQKGIRPKPHWMPPEPEEYPAHQKEYYRYQNVPRPPGVRTPKRNEIEYVREERELLTRQTRLLT